MKLSKNDERNFRCDEKLVLKVIDIINEVAMCDIFNLSIVRLNDNVNDYQIRFVTDNDVWNDIISEFDKVNFELILKPNQITYLRKKV